MWIFTSESFLSVSAARDMVDAPEYAVDGDWICVRGRKPEDIADFLTRHAPDADVTHTPHRDYQYRAYVPRVVFERALLDEAQAIDYPKFKPTVPEHDAERYDAYMGVWEVMYQWGREKPKPIRWYNTLDLSVTPALNLREPRACAECGEPIDPAPTTRKYCGPECARQARMVRAALRRHFEGKQ